MKESGTTYDAIIIGSGQGGTSLAKGLAKQGWKTALVEREHVGGTCTNVGCTPAKTLLASAKTAHTVAKASEWGIVVKDFTVDMPAILARKQKIVEESRNGEQDKIEATPNLTLLMGEASFTTPTAVKIQYPDGRTETITAASICIDTGTRPQIPPVAGLEEVGYLTSTTVMELDAVPGHLLIIGGNYIGLEFGQTFRRLGSQVTILEHSERLLSKEDEDISAVILQCLEEEGMVIKTGTEAKSIERVADSLSVIIETGDKTETIQCTHILVASGIQPNTETLNLLNAGVKTDEDGYIETNEFLETSVKGIYALGDVKGGPAYTSIAYNDYLVLYNNLIGKERKSIKDRIVPYCMFTDPQLGRVGITEAEARKMGKAIKVATHKMEHVTRARTTNNTKGLMKAVVDADSGQILGAAMVGAEGGETMAVIQMAMVGKVPYNTIAQMVIAHPLYAKALNNLFLSIDK